MLEKDPRSPRKKIRLFRERFSGLEHVYGTYDPATGRAWQVKQSVTDTVILDHLRGKRPFGVYLLTGDRTRAAAVDYDTDDANLPLDFIAAAKGYGLEGHVEISKSKGFHVWLFFAPEGAQAAKARAVIRHVLEETGQKAEVFPKQDTINPGRGEYGNFINAPFWGRLVPQGRTVFADPWNGMRPMPNQWRYLEQIEAVTESLLDEIIEVNGIPMNPAPVQGQSFSLGTFEAPWSFPPCMRRMLDEGVTSHQRVACFRLSIQLRKIGMPLDIAIAALAGWALKNRPQKGRRIITLDEIASQASMAFLKEYQGYGCDDPAIAAYCDPSCPIHIRGNRD